MAARFQFTLSLLEGAVKPKILVEMLAVHPDVYKRQGSLRYLPQQGDDRKGLVANYEIYAGMEKDAMQRVAEGEFSNIRNNPVMQEVFFTPTHCRYVQLRATRMVNAGEKIAYQQVIIR